MNAAFSLFFGACSAGLLTFLLIDQGPLVHIGERYSKHLKKHFVFMFIKQSPDKIAAVHLGILCSFIVLATVFQSIALAFLIPVLLCAPEYLRLRAESKKREKISEQLAPWLTVLSNNLKSAPNIADAFAASTAFVEAPLRDEIELLVKEVRLGEHLNRAMNRSSLRVQSPLYSSVMSTLLVARKSGGNLPKILAESSDTLREMERLAGVVRTKTAEGRSQTIALLILPFLMIAGLAKADPQLVPSLLDSGTGKTIIACSIALWLSAIALSKRIMKVDI